MPKYLTNLDLNQNQLLKARIENYAGNPNGVITGAAGQLLWDSVGSKLYACVSGTTWTIASGEFTDTNTTYGISAETATGGVNLRLTGSDASTDDVKLANGANVTLTRTDANTITIAATDTNTTYTAGDGLGLTGTVFSLDTPSTVSAASTNAVTADSHTHAVTTTTAAAVSTIVATDASGNITGNRLISNVAQGTAPLDVTSTTVVTNLNADLLDGNHASAFAVSGHNHTLDSLSNVTITANSDGEILRWNGTAWINNTLAEAGIQAAGTYLTPTSTNVVTNKSLSDSTTWFVDAADNTRRVNIDVTGTTGITGVLQTAFTTAKTIAFPDLAGTVALTANKLSVFAATTSDELRGVISDETGTGGGLVFATGPTLSTPVIDDVRASGAAATADLYSEVTTGSISVGAGLTTGTLNVAAVGTGATNINIGHTNAISTLTGAFRLPTAGTDGILTLGALGAVTRSAVASGALTFLTTPTSANLRTLVTDDTGSGGSLVFSTSPTLSSPVIDDIVASGVAVAGDIFSEITTGSVTIGAGLTTGDVFVGTAQTTGGEITLGSANSIVRIPGQVSITGTLTTVNSNEVDIGDSNILLNADITTNAGNSNGGISVKRLMIDNTTRKDAQLNYNTTTDRWEMAYGPVADALITQNIPAKYAQTLSTSATSYVITHNLGTQDVQVTLYEVGSPFAVVYADVEHTSTSTVTLRFAVAPAINTYRVVIIG